MVQHVLQRPGHNNLPNFTLTLHSLSLILKVLIVWDLVSADFPPKYHIEKWPCENDTAKDTHKQMINDFHVLPTICNPTLCTPPNTVAHSHLLHIETLGIQLCWYEHCRHRQHVRSRTTQRPTNPTAKEICVDRHKIAVFDQKIKCFWFFSVLASKGSVYDGVVDTFLVLFMSDNNNNQPLIIRKASPRHETNFQPANRQPSTEAPSRRGRHTYPLLIGRKLKSSQKGRHALKISFGIIGNSLAEVRTWGAYRYENGCKCSLWHW